MRKRSKRKGTANTRAGVDVPEKLMRDKNRRGKGKETSRDLTHVFRDQEGGGAARCSTERRKKKGRTRKTISRGKIKSFRETITKKKLLSWEKRKENVWPRHAPVRVALRVENVVPTIFKVSRRKGEGHEGDGKRNFGRQIYRNVKRKNPHIF